MGHWPEVSVVLEYVVEPAILHLLIWFFIGQSEGNLSRVLRGVETYAFPLAVFDFSPGMSSGLLFVPGCDRTASQA